MKPEESPIVRGALPLADCPEDVWARIEAQLQMDTAPARPAMGWRAGFGAWRWVAATLCAAIALTAWFGLREAPRTWTVERDGFTAQVAEGDWIETGAERVASIEVGQIGVVRVEPNSRVRIVRATPTEHRLELAEGEIEAEINAPPRLFFVHTPATTATDLGCAYRMKTDEAGNGSLHVTGGWVELERDAGTSLVPAGASCRIRPWQGAGTPYFDDAPAALIAALDEFDERGQGLNRILRLARARDTLTLWHLLARVAAEDRARVFERMAELAPPPAEVTRERVLVLDEQALQRWREELAWVW